MKLPVILAVFALMVSAAADQLITVTLEDTLRDPKVTDVTSPAAVAAARVSGAAQAGADVAVGKLEIIEYGEPLEEPMPPVIRRDPGTGLPVRSIHNCTPTAAFEAYVTAYNQVVREAHANRKR